MWDRDKHELRAVVAGAAAARGNEWRAIAVVTTYCLACSCVINLEHQHRVREKRAAATGRRTPPKGGLDGIEVRASAVFG